MGGGRTWYGKRETLTPLSPPPPSVLPKLSHQPPSWICRARKAGARKKFVPRGWRLGMAEHDWTFALTSPYCRYVLWRNVIERLIISCDLIERHAAWDWLRDSVVVLIQKFSFKGVGISGKFDQYFPVTTDEQTLADFRKTCYPLGHCEPDHWPFLRTLLPLNFYHFFVNAVWSLHCCNLRRTI